MGVEKNEMKTKITAALIVLFLILGGGAAILLSDPIPTTIAEEKGTPQQIPHCPTTLISDNTKCLMCHVMSGNKFVVKKFPSDSHIVYPDNTKIIEANGKKEGLYVMYGEIGPQEYDNLFKAFNFYHEYNISKVTIEIYSYGGDLFSAWRIKGLSEEWVAQGGKLNTKVYGGAISAAAILFAIGQERIIHAQAEIMFHELWSFKFFDVSTPSDKEDEARVLRHLQDNITSWLATRCNKTKNELDELMKKREYWLNGKEAFEIGLATKLING